MAWYCGGVGMQRMLCWDWGRDAHLLFLACFCCCFFLRHHHRCCHRRRCRRPMPSLNAFVLLSQRLARSTLSAASKECHCHLFLQCVLFVCMFQRGVPRVLYVGRSKRSVVGKHVRNRHQKHVNIKKGNDRKGEDYDYSSSIGLFLK